MMVKVCGITNREDALAAVEAGVSALGFNFYRESPRYVSPTGAAMIAGKIPAAVWKVGVFVNETPEAVAKIALEVGLDVAQLHGTSEARGIRIWRALRADESLVSQLGDAAEALLFDAPSEELYGGTGRTFDWSRARIHLKKIIVAGGLDASNVRQAIEQAQPWGVDACSRLEKSPGIKDHEKMRNFVKAALEL
ncbi:MAG TPA: phosphoribosylanthranilate isomerase [Bryobacteraceae bacterium]|nr:phosphoribosylanthranilate isomerase [Bryobacteraceae bacterium]